jgi:predicted Zn-dependent protease
MTYRLLSGKIGETVESRLTIIDLLAKNSFIDAASARYASLVKDHPDEPALRLGYVSFLLKYGNEEEALSVWK